ncbi:acylphosphatase [Cellulomonas sp. P22]|uniref:acylphosphatase n=1 Tax=Cellulomonas sp. P22 TaxID=3373189 RepID=UPI0037B2AE2D
MIARQVVVRGVVQGVGFRAALVAEARRLGVTGWVRNRADGAVEALVVGGREPVDALVGWAHRGPRFASVSSVEVRDATPDGSPAFTSSVFTVER